MDVDAEASAAKPLFTSRQALALHKILIVLPTLDQSGAEKQFSLLATHLPRDEFEVRVVALQRGGPAEQSLRDAKIPFDILNKRLRLDPRNLAQLRSLISEWQPDVIVSALFAANASVRLATLAMKNAPAILISERCVDSWKSGWQLWLDRRLAPRMKAMVANSASVADFYAQQGIDRERIRVIHNGVQAPPEPAITRAQLLTQLQLPPDAKLVATVGRLAKQKRVQDLLWAAQLLRQFDPRAKLLVIGDGPLRGELALYAQDVEVEQHVRFLGHRADAASLLRLVDVFWLASEFEGQSNSLMEAMSCGLPVIVSDIPANRELVRHGEEGWLVDVGDSAGFSQFTHKLWQEDGLAKRMGAAGQQRMRDQFSVEAMVAHWADLLRQTMADRTLAVPSGSSAAGR